MDSLDTSRHLSLSLSLFPPPPPLSLSLVMQHLVVRKYYMLATTTATCGYIDDVSAAGTSIAFSRFSECPLVSLEICGPSGFFLQPTID